MLVSSLLAVAFGPMRAAGLELLIAGSALLLAAAVRKEVTCMQRHSKRCALICGFFWIANFVFFWLAVSAARSNQELIVVGLLNYLWPVCTLLLTIPILKKQASLWLIPGLVAAVVGVLITKISTSPELSIARLFDDLNFFAYSCALIDAVAWGLYSNYSRKLSHPDGASLVPGYMIVASCMLLAYSSWEHTPLQANSSDWMLLIAWGLCSSLAFLFWDIGMRKGNVVAISSTSMLIPLFSTLITALLSGYGLSLGILLGALLVVSGSWLCSKGVR